MEVIDRGSSSKSDAVNAKPVIVRVKRKASQSPLEAFWLEINERPLKRPLLDFSKLSLSVDSSKKEESKMKKVLLQHVETVSSSDGTIDLLHSFVDSDSADTFNLKIKFDERKRAFKEENKQNQLLCRSRKKHEFHAKISWFEQIWNKRRGSKESMNDGSLHETYHLYDIVRVDVEMENSNKREDVENMLLEDYLSLLQEFLPSVAEKVQFNMQTHHSEQVFEDDYVYDVYAAHNKLIPSEEDVLNSYPLVQVDDNDYFYDRPCHSDFETDDSNAEDNPHPEETSGGEEEEGDDDDENDDDEGNRTSHDLFEEIKSSHSYSDQLNDERSDDHFEDEDLL